MTKKERYQTDYEFILNEVKSINKFEPLGAARILEKANIYIVKLNDKLRSDEEVMTFYAATCNIKAEAKKMGLTPDQRYCINDLENQLAHVMVGVFSRGKGWRLTDSNNYTWEDTDE